MPQSPPATTDRPIEPDRREPRDGRILRWLDSFAYSSLLAATIAAAFAWTASRLLGEQRAWHWALVCATGTFLIYNLDRLRDIERDRHTSPRRTAFIEHHRSRLGIATAVAAFALAALLLDSPPAAIGLAIAIGGLGFFHRRLKRSSAFKTLYVSTAWVAACVGLPWIAGGAAARSAAAPNAAWIASILLATLTANLIASNLRDDETQMLRQRPNRVLWVARSATLIAMGLSVLAPEALRALVWIPLWECFALANDRPSERAGHVAIDGALLAGAWSTAIHLAAIGATGAG